MLVLNVVQIQNRVKQYGLCMCYTFLSTIPVGTFNEHLHNIIWLESIFK